VSHRYRHSGNYSIALSWTDPVGPANQAILPVTVTDVPPVVHAGGNATFNVAGLLLRTGTFTDPGADLWTAVVDYGDGSRPQHLKLQGQTFHLSHWYNHRGTFHVVITVTDDGGAAGSGSFTVTVK
jgi:hypothetical protein